MDNEILKDKVIVISGGTKGVGRAAAEEFSRRGAKVVIGGRDEVAAKKILSETSNVIFVHTDLKNISDCKNLFDETNKKFGRLDGFFNYAGVTPVSPLDTCDE